MLEDDFLKERQNIREKMLKYSRAVTKGQPLDEELREEISSDDILRRRFSRKSIFDDFEPEDKKSSIYLKEDLINVKLEEKESLTLKVFSYLKEKKNKQKSFKNNKKTKKIFSLSFHKKGTKNLSMDLKKQKEFLLKAPLLKEEPKDQNSADEELHLHKQEADFFEKDNPHNKLFKTQKNNTFIKKPSKLPKTNALNLKNEEDNEKTKNVLLQGYENAVKEDKNLNFNHLLFVALLASFALVLFVPQIYIRNQIYYLSREITTLRSEENVLNEENKELKRKLENMRFQNQILDYLE